MPLSQGNLSNMRVLELEHNTLSGVIPGAVARLPVLQALDIRDNDLSDGIPEQLADVWMFLFFFAGGDLFSGCIPFGQRIKMARTLGEKVEGATARWLVLSGPGQLNDLERLNIPYCEAPEFSRAMRSNGAEKLRALIDAGAKE